MYLLYLDESGSHGPGPGNHAYVLGGVAVHEGDAVALQQALSDALLPFLPPGVDPDRMELHAAEIFRPRREEHSPWRGVHDRKEILRTALAVIGDFEPADPSRPLQIFGALVDPGDPDAAGVAYEAVLNRFDDTIARLGEHGVAISDVGHNEGAELLLQRRTERWRRTAGAYGRLDRLCDVLFFSDSKASRLLQAADLLAWSLWREHGAMKPDERWLAPVGSIDLLDLR